MKNNTLGERINFLRKNKKLTQHTLAKKLNVSDSTLSQYETGARTPSDEIKIKIANIFNVSIDYLIGYSNAKNTNIETLTQDREKSVKIPVLGKVAAGVPIEAIEEIIEWEEIPIEWTYGDKEYFGLKVKGDSMYPEYLENDTVIVHKTTEFNSGNDCVVYINGYDSTLKTVIKNADDSITLKPINPEYPPKTFSKDEIINYPVIICGVIVELRRKK